MYFWPATLILEDVSMDRDCVYLWSYRLDAERQTLGSEKGDCRDASPLFDGCSELLEI